MRGGRESKEGKVKLRREGKVTVWRRNGEVKKVKVNKGRVTG